MKEENILPACDMSLGQRIKYLRQTVKEPQAKFASHIGISQGNLSDMEKDKYLPSLSTLTALIEYYGFASDWILFGIGPLYAIDYKEYDEKSDNSLSDDDNELLSVYRDLDPEGKSIVKTTCYTERRRMKSLNDHKQRQA